jgi:fatty acid desaturase
MPVFTFTPSNQKNKKTMKKNMGNEDRIIRVVAAIAIIALYFGGVISGAVATILLVVAAAFIATSFVSFCPLYLPFGLNTIRKKLSK